MTAQTQQQPATDTLPDYSSILVAVDSSDHANRGVQEAIALAGRYGSRLTGTHVYAAKLHDMRFRQMEGGLPEQYREEQELERQRDVHDDLITRGLSIITDSYLDQMDTQAQQAGLQIRRRSLEGKNYSALNTEANNGNYDLLVMGALGLGAVRGSRLGSVCQRVARRSQIDTLIIKDPLAALNKGPIVVAIDGSAKAYGGLLTGLSLAQQWRVPLKVISAFDPYYHYVAFNRIAGVLSAEAGQVFRFQEQEKLHEEIIDSGLAKIYQGHLAVAQSIASDHNVEIESVLLDGKPHEVIQRYLKQTRPTLLIVGTTGIHADEGLDIGGNSENLLNDAECAVLLSQREHSPQVDRLASVSTAWTNEAEARMERVPSFVRSMAKMAILRYAQEHGHTVITESIVDQATAELMPNHAEQAMQEIVEAHDSGALKSKPTAENAMRWHTDATRLLLTIKDLSLRGNLSMRAEKKARSENSREVLPVHIRPFLDDTVETAAFNPGAEAATLPGAGSQPESACPFGFSAATARQSPQQGETGQAAPGWTDEARDLIQGVPVGFCRDMTLKAAESMASAQGKAHIDSDFVNQVLATIKQGSEAISPAMPWSDEARERLTRVPDMVRGMLVREIESWVTREGGQEVTETALDAVRSQWMDRGVFHLDPQDPRSQATPTTTEQPIENAAEDHQQPTWQAAALARLMRVPEGFMRDASKNRIEDYARKQGLDSISLQIAEAGLAQAREAMQQQMQDQ